jgi:hypothetical protein
VSTTNYTSPTKLAAAVTRVLDELRTAEYSNGVPKQSATSNETRTRITTRPIIVMAALIIINKKRNLLAN